MGAIARPSLMPPRASASAPSRSRRASVTTTTTRRTTIARSSRSTTRASASASRAQRTAAIARDGNEAVVDEDEDEDEDDAMVGRARTDMESSPTPTRRSRGRRAASASRSGTKRNLSARFEQTASENAGGDDDDDDDDAEATSGERPLVKRRKLTLAERLVRRVELTMTRSTSKELRIIDGRRFDRAMCVIVDDAVENVGEVDVACAKALEMSAKATGSSFGLTPVGLQTMRMVVDGGCGDAYAFPVAADAKSYLSALIEAEERLGPEVAAVPVKKRRRLARALMNLSNFARPPQYRYIEREKYDEAACHIADVSMETNGKIDLACAKAIHASVRDGGSHWGITATELKTLKMLARGGRGVLVVKLEDDAKRYLETVVEKEETLLTTTTTTTTTTSDDEDTESDDEPSPKRAKAGVLTHLIKLVRRKQYRYIDGARFDEDACNIADESMERIGRIDLECAKTIHTAILEGGSRWGITNTEYATVRLFIDGGRDDVLYICDNDAKLYLLNVLGTQAVEEAANVTPPTKVHVRQAPASALQSALKNPPPSALKTNAKSAKKKGVIFTPSRRFQTRTYVPSPTSGNSEEEFEDDTTDEEEEETNDDATDSRLEETREDEEEEDVEPTRRATDDDAMVVYAPSIMTAFYDSMQFWMTPVSVLDTAAACIMTLAVFCVAHVSVIATFEATITPASVLAKTETSM